jgi:membrane dipeptidase
MRIIDPHIDLADFYKLNHWTKRDFFSEDSPAWVTLPKLQTSGIDVVGFTLYFDESFKQTTFHDGVRSFHHFYQDLLSEQTQLLQITSKIDFKNKPKDKIGYFYAIEGMECFNEPKDFNLFYDLGVRCFSFTWSFDNNYASGRDTNNNHGLTNQGREVLNLMKEQNNLIIDVVHASPKTINDIANAWDGVLVTTHSNASSVHPNLHNLSDEEIDLIVERKGVISLLPLNECTGSHGTFEELYRHLDYIASKWGLEYVAFSSDIYPVPEYPFLENTVDIGVASKWYRYLQTRLSDEEVDKVMWGNWARILSTAL